MLGDLTEDNFNRLMLAMTEWIAPEQSCAYCHGEEGNFASDDLYTKVVARRMIQMTQNINETWTDHVAPAGVTCYTCHRGQNVPSGIWFEVTPTVNAMAGWGAVQNRVTSLSQSTSLPSDALQKYLVEYEPVRVSDLAPRVENEGTASVQDTERTFSLMNYFSNALGTNCGFCHNSRAFYDLDQSTPQLVQAQLGIGMALDLNNDYLLPYRRPAAAEAARRTACRRAEGRLRDLPQGPFEADERPERHLGLAGAREIRGADLRLTESGATRSEAAPRLEEHTMARESDLRPVTPLLDRVHSPADLRRMSDGELAAVADELRAELISAVSQTGGHLGSSLGVVELTVAIHAVFNTPYDKLIWDVGHQCYPHKIVTGRRGRIRTLRQAGGLSGFTKRSESPYDPFGAAHSSTSISAGLGLTVARDLGEATGDVVTVIGDGAISAGMAYEAMNNAGADGRRMFVILNDNEMSIAPPVGAMSKYLSGLYANTPLYALEGDRRRVRAHPARAVPRRRPQGAQPGHGHGRNRRHALRGAWLFLCRADRRPRHEPAAAGAARGPGTGDGSGADPLRDGQGQGLRPGGDVGRQVSRRREVRRGHRGRRRRPSPAPRATPRSSARRWCARPRPIRASSRSPPPCRTGPA